LEGERTRTHTEGTDVCVKPNQPQEQGPTKPEAAKREAWQRDLLRKLPNQTQPAEEWGERLDTGKTIATSGKETGAEEPKGKGENRQP